MREKLNENPLVQAVVIGVLALLIVFLFITRMGGGGGDTTPATDTTATVPTDASGTAAPSATAPAIEGATPAPAPATGAPPDGTTAVALGTTGAFVVGPGLPAPLVKAYADGKVVVLLITRAKGIDDRELKERLASLRSDGDVALFETNAKSIARYSRIASGVDVDRTPAMVVLKPRRTTEGLPVASVYYGFRGPNSVQQAIRDARYSGRDNLPYFPK